MDAERINLELYETRLFEGDLVFLDPIHESRPVGRLSPDGTFAYARVDDETDEDAKARQENWAARIADEYGSLDTFLEAGLEMLHRVEKSPIAEWRTR